MTAFPRTTVGGVSLPRMIAGTNWIFGYSHTGAAADQYIRQINHNRKAVADILETFLNHDINAFLGPFAGFPFALDGIKEAEDRTGKGIVLIDTPVINVDDTAEGRKEAERVITQSQELGAAFCLLHHSSVEQLVNKNLKAIPRLPDYLDMIRQHGMLPGLSAHMPELVTYSDLNQYDVETYIQIYNCMGFMMQVEIEYVNRVIWNAQKPVITIKPMAAGRTTPFVGITFNYNTIREKDMVCVGCMTPREAAEDIEIGLAAIEHRRPDLEGRNSPNKTSIMQ